MDESKSYRKHKSDTHFEGCPKKTRSTYTDVCGTNEEKKESPEYGLKQNCNTVSNINMQKDEKIDNIMITKIKSEAVVISDTELTKEFNPHLPIKTEKYEEDEEDVHGPSYQNTLSTVKTIEDEINIDDQRISTKSDVSSYLQSISPDLVVIKDEVDYDSDREMEMLLYEEAKELSKITNNPKNIEIMEEAFKENVLGRKHIEAIVDVTEKEIIRSIEFIDDALEENGTKHKNVKIKVEDKSEMEHVDVKVEVLEENHKKHKNIDTTERLFKKKVTKYRNTKTTKESLNKNNTEHNSVEIVEKRSEENLTKGKNIKSHGNNYDCLNNVTPKIKINETDMYEKLLRMIAENEDSFVFDCAVCTLSFSHLEDFHCHLKKQHINMHLKFLTRTFTSCRVLVAFLDTKRGTQREQCIDCELSFDNMATLNTHKDQQAYECHKCNAQLPTCFELKSHLKSCCGYYSQNSLNCVEFKQCKQISDSAFTVHCPVCMCPCLDENELLAHQVSKHRVRSDHSNNLTPKECKDCQKKFFGRRDAHFCEKRRDRINCKMCKKSFQTYLLLHVHLKAMYQSNTVCETCHKPFIMACEKEFHVCEIEMDYSEKQNLYGCMICLMTNEKVCMIADHLLDTHQIKYSLVHRNISRIIRRSVVSKNNDEREHEGVSADKNENDVIIELIHDDKKPARRTHSKNITKRKRLKKKIDDQNLNGRDNQEQISNKVSATKRKKKSRNVKKTSKNECGDVSNKGKSLEQYDSLLDVFRGKTKYDTLNKALFMADIKTEPTDTDDDNDLKDSDGDTYNDDKLIIDEGTDGELSSDSWPLAKYSKRNKIEKKRRRKQKQNVISKCTKCNFQSFRKLYKNHRCVQKYYSKKKGNGKKTTRIILIHDVYCNLCYRNFFTLTQYFKHFTKHYLKRQQCPYCMTIVGGGRVNLYQHCRNHITSNYYKCINLHSTKMKYYKCTQCQDNVSNEELLEHYELHNFIKMKNQDLDTEGNVEKKKTIRKKSIENEIEIEENVEKKKTIRKKSIENEIEIEENVETKKTKHKKSIENEKEIEHKTLYIENDKCDENLKICESLNIENDIECKEAEQIVFIENEKLHATIIIENQTEHDRFDKKVNEDREIDESLDIETIYEGSNKNGTMNDSNKIKNEALRTTTMTENGLKDNRFDKKVSKAREIDEGLKIENKYEGSNENITIDYNNKVESKELPTSEKIENCTEDDSFDKKINEDQKTDKSFKMETMYEGNLTEDKIETEKVHETTKIRNNTDEDVFNEKLNPKIILPHLYEEVEEILTNCSQNKASEKTCVICNKNFDRKVKFQGHLIEHLYGDALSKGTSESDLKCQICSKVLNCASTFKCHLREHALLPLY